MPAYTKEQFEEYKGDSKSLKVKYYVEFEAVEHESYEDYIQFYKWFYNSEDDK